MSPLEDLLERLKRHDNPELDEEIQDLEKLVAQSGTMSKIISQRVLIREKTLVGLISELIKAPSDDAREKARCLVATHEADQARIEAWVKEQEDRIQDFLKSYDPT